jgi:transposase
MPKNHQAQIEWTPERIMSWAGTIGPETAHFVEAVMAARLHPQQGFRSCVGILRLAKGYGKARLEAACKRALLIKSYSYKSIESILKNNLEAQPLPTTPTTTNPPTHEYVRGQEYYQ